jgi:predicted nucleic acid-binding protein
VTTLLDANVLIALVVADHVHHDPADAWLAGLPGHFTTCPITEGSLASYGSSFGREGHPTPH